MLSKLLRFEYERVFFLGFSLTIQITQCLLFKLSVSFSFWKCKVSHVMSYSSCSVGVCALPLSMRKWNELQSNFGL